MPSPSLVILCDSNVWGFLFFLFFFSNLLTNALKKMFCIINITETGIEYVKYSK